MYRNMIRNTTMALGTLLLGSTLVMAGGLQGSVTALDSKGMATVHTTDGKDHQVKAEGLKVGTKVECETKNNNLECHATAPMAAANPMPSTVAPAPAKSAPAPAPVTSTPAPSSAAPAPSTSTPAPASK
jgi:hypothetical protein